MATINILGVDVEAPDSRFVNNISGKNYLSVAGKLDLTRRVLVAMGKPNEFEVTRAAVVTPTPVPGWVFVEVETKLPWGLFAGVAGSDTKALNRKGEPDVQAQAPAEVAYTSAIGKALTAAGLDPFGNMASADEMRKVGAGEQTQTRQATGAAASNESRPALAIPEPNDGAGGYVCEDPDCDNDITASGKYSAAQNAGYSVRATGKIYCPQHRREAEEAANAKGR